MTSMTQTETKLRLLRAITSSGKRIPYLNFLGFCGRRNAKKSTGRPAFRGIIRDFYEAIINIARVLATTYGSLDELQNEIETQQNFTQSLIENTIEEYGSIIWNDGRYGFQTMIDNAGDGKGPYYPRYLIYNNESDRLSIRTHTYCFILSRIPQYITTAARGPRVNRADMTEIGPVAVEPTRIVSSASASPIMSESRSLEDIDEYQAPVAPMFPTVNTEVVSSSSAVPQSNNGGTSPLMRNNVAVTEAHSQPSETAQPGILHTALDSLDQASNRNSRQREETSESLPVRKRKWSAQGAAADTNFQSPQPSEPTDRIVRPKKGPTVDVSPPTSPDTISGVTNNSAGQRPMKRASNRTTRHNVSETDSERFQSRRSRSDADTNVDFEDDSITVTTLHIDTPNSNENMADENIGELDSVVGSSRPLPSQEEQDEDNEPTLMVKPRIQNKEAIHQRNLFRWDLGTTLLTFFDDSSEQVKVLEEVIKLIEDIRQLDNSLPQSGSNGINVPNQSILNQWVELVNIYLRSRKYKNCINDERTRDTPRNSHEYNQRFKRMVNLGRICRDAQIWSNKHENYDTYIWSKCVVSTLLDMAKWGEDLTTEDREEIRKRLVQFNENLIKDLFRSKST